MTATYDEISVFSYSIMYSNLIQMDKLFFCIATALLLTACQQNSAPQTQPELPAQAVSLTQPPDQFAEYWYQGKAEISSYALEQARYGEIHDGHAVLVYVTEDFSKKKQVKLDHPEQAGADRVPILKLNFVKKFTTGIYPYSLMQSVFSPVDVQAYPHALKTSMSAQEWCGHTFTQYNLQGKQYRIHGFSYFESEGDVELKLPAVWLEDEVWTRIRLQPQSLPTGTVEMVPASFYLRLAHKPFEVQQAEATLSSPENEPQTRIYELYYPAHNRRLRIRFESEFPHRILSWEEQYPDGFGPNAKVLTTKASLINRLNTAYWRQHNNEHEGLRAQLGLPEG